MLLDSNNEPNKSNESNEPEKKRKKKADRTTMDQYVVIRDYFKANVKMEEVREGVYAYPVGCNDSVIAKYIVEENPQSNITKAHVRFVRQKLGFLVKKPTPPKPKSKKEEIEDRLNVLENAMRLLANATDARLTKQEKKIEDLEKDIYS